MVVPIVEDGQVYDRLDLKSYRTSGGQIVEVEAPLGQHPAGSIILKDSNRVLSFPQMNPDLERTFPQMGLWRIGD